jgi:EF-hand domain pair
LRAFRLCILALMAGLAACSAPRPKGPPIWTPEKEPPRDENFHGGPNATLLQYDANHDGTLTRAELIAGLKADFDKLDTNHNGCLTPDQVAAINAQRIAADQSTATPLQDWNQDGCVDLREFSNAAYSLFDQMDKNGDGKITPQEFNPGKKPGSDAGTPPAGGGRRGGPGGGPP